MATGLDYVINERLLSTTRVAYQNTHAERTNGEGVPTLAMLGVNSWMYTQGKIPGQDMLQAGLWGSGFTGNFYVNTPQISQDFDWTLGSHSLSFGGSWTRPSSTGDGPFQADGAFTFDGLMTSGTANANGGLNFADFLLGTLEIPAWRQPDQRRLRACRGRICERHLARQLENHRERRPALGAVLRAAGPERLRHRLEP